MTKTYPYPATAAISAAILSASLMLAPQATLAEMNPKPTSAVAVLIPTSGSSVQGTLHFSESGSKTAIDGSVSGLSPSGKHGFHIHEFGDCSAEDGTSAGGHFNPTNAQHGAPGSTSHHIGDFGNIAADESGAVAVEMNSPSLLLSGPNSVVGRAVVIHKNADDLKSQPSGDAGARVACGVIGIAGK